ncbi:MAG: 2-oxoacid:acceptor oxidoreductase family protein [Clostridia bacterium]|nr:2-oxoacid:acceptor oxidoreductase family protein [Clostridia bacterium]
MKTTNILISGFGGQGVLFTGKFLAYEGLLENKEVTWLPSYGPEMRGGTASCSVIISDTAIGSPLVPHPDILIAMNLPSLDRFEDAVVPGGMIFYDSSLIDRPVKRTDVKAFGVPATKLADEAGMSTLANMIVMGKMLRESGLFPYDAVDRTIQKVVSAKRQNLVELNKKAIAMGYEL